jgi:small subunit ribosomal protein S20
MANIASQKKRNARNERERLENRRRVSQVKTWFRRLEAAVDAGDASLADQEHHALVSRIDRAVKIGALHPNTGARRKARAARTRARLS